MNQVKKAGNVTKYLGRISAPEEGAASVCLSYLRTIKRVAAGAAKKLAQPAYSRRHVENGDNPRALPQPRRRY